MMTEVLTYLDYNATAPVTEAARAAVADALRHDGNASSVHRFGRLARRLIEAGRGKVAASVGADPSSVVFTSGGTEANDLAIGGAVAAGVTRISAPAIEHPAVLDSARATGVDCIVVPCLSSGVIDRDALQRALNAPAARDGRTLVALMLANNETGVIQPVAEIARLAHEHHAWLHCDAIQALAKIPVDVAELGADTVSLSAHKVGGPQGVGALIVQGGVPLKARLHGGGQERGLRSGTENLPGIAGFAAAVADIERRVDALRSKSALRDRLEQSVLAMAPDAVIFGRDAPRLANTSYIALPGLPADPPTLAPHLAGVAVSSGSACSSGKVGASHVLRAMGAEDEAAKCAVRVSLGWDTDENDIDRLLDAWTALYRRAAPQRQRA